MGKLSLCDMERWKAKGLLVLRGHTATTKGRTETHSLETGAGALMACDIAIYHKKYIQ